MKPNTGFAKIKFCLDALNANKLPCWQKAKPNPCIAEAGRICKVLNLLFRLPSYSSSSACIEMMLALLEEGLKCHAFLLLSELPI